MGFYFRKSLGLLGGLFRLNFSKKGVGISAGIKGARLVFGPAGTYVHLGRNGFYYKKYLGKDSFKSNSNKTNLSEYQQLEVNEFPVSLITENFGKITDSESKEFIQELQLKVNKISFYKILGLYPLLFIIPILAFLSIKNYSELFHVLEEEEFENLTTIINQKANLRDKPTSLNSQILYQAKQGEQFKFLDSIQENWIRILKEPNDTLFIHTNLVHTSRVKIGTLKREVFNSKAEKNLYLLGGVVIALLFWNFSLSFIDKKRKSINIIYEKDDLLRDIENQMQSSFNEFLMANGKWQILSSQKSQNKKYSSGAATLNRRVQIKNASNNSLPNKFFKTNVRVPFIKLFQTEFYFFPDMLILKQSNQIAGIQYDRLILDSRISRFIEEEKLYPDAEIIDYTFKYINKNGGPDQRFSNNPKLPICSYSEYSLTSKDGLKAVLLTSKRGAMDSFISVLNMLARIEASEESIDEILNSRSF